MPRFLNRFSTLGFVRFDGKSRPLAADAHRWAVAVPEKGGSPGQGDAGKDGQIRPGIKPAEGHHSSEEAQVPAGWGCRPTRVAPDALGPGAGGDLPAGQATRHGEGDMFLRYTPTDENVSRDRMPLVKP